MYGSSGPQGNDRFYPVAPEATFAALRQVASSRYRVRSADEFSKALTFSSRAGLLSWGENFTAHVTPTPGGSVLRVSGVGRMGGALQQAARTNKQLNAIFEGVAAILRTQVGT